MVAVRKSTAILLTEVSLSLSARAATISGLIISSRRCSDYFSMNIPMKKRGAPWAVAEVKFLTTFLSPVISESWWRPGACPCAARISFANILYWKPSTTSLVRISYWKQWGPPWAMTEVRILTTFLLISESSLASLSACPSAVRTLVSNILFRKPAATTSQYDYIVKTMGCTLSHGSSKENNCAAFDHGIFIA